MGDSRDTPRHKKGERLPRRWRDAKEFDSNRLRDLERRNCTKYHYVKFVEKKKVNRKLNTCKRLLLAANEAGNEEEAADLRKQMKVHLADMEYIEHYPRHLPYNALFPAADSEASKQRREQIREVIRKKLQEEKEQEQQEGDEQEEALDAEEAPKVKGKKAKGKKAKATVVEEEAPPAKPKKKRKASSEAAEDPAEAPPRNKKAKRRQGAASEEEPVVPKKKALGKEAKAKKRKGGAAAEELHPSWSAAKKASASGALVEAEGKKTVFAESDSEG